MATAFYIEYPRITAIELSGTARKPKVKRVVVGDLLEPRNDDGTLIADRQAYLNEKIGAFVKEHKLAGGKTYLLAGPDAMRYRELKLAFSDKRQIGRVLQFQVEGVIPNIPIDQLTIGYNLLTSEPDGARLLVHAADKEHIRQRIIALEEAGCSVEAVDSNLSGTLNLGLLHAQFAKGSPPALWLDFAGTAATVSIVQDGEVQTSRVFLSPYLAGASGATSTAEEAKEAARRLQQEAEQRAREFQGSSTDSVNLPKSESVNIGEGEVADRIRHMSRDELDKFIRRVAVEARRTLMISSHDAAPERLVVSGLGTEGDKLTRLLAEELEMPESAAIELMDVVDPKRELDAPDVGELTYLCGVALKGLGRDYTGIDFRYGDLAPGTLLDYAKTPLAFTATLVLLFAGIMFLVNYAQAREYEKNIAALRNQDRGPEYFFKAAFYHVNKTDKPTPEVAKERSYPSNPEAPGDEIRLAHKRLKDHQKRLQGQVEDNYVKPYPGDQILAQILKTIESAKPSYDFTLLKLHVLESGVTIEYMASLTESQAERDRLGVGTMVEADRMFDAFRKLAAARPEWFEGDPEQTQSSRGQEGPEGRKADQMTLKLKLKKIEPPKKTTTAKKTGAN